MYLMMTVGTLALKENYSLMSDASLSKPSMAVVLWQAQIEYTVTCVHQI